MPAVIRSHRIAQQSGSCASSKRAHITITGSSDHDRPELMITPSPESAKLLTFSYLLANF
jgi:hypothetical protein